jgi:hypothetical protein
MYDRCAQLDITVGASSCLGGASALSLPSCSCREDLDEEGPQCSSIKLSVMDDTERDKVESGVADGRERGDDIDLFSLGKSPAHFCISTKLAGRMFSRPEWTRPLALGRSWSLALEPEAMVGGGLCDHEVTRRRVAPEDDQNSVRNVAGELLQPPDCVGAEELGRNGLRESCVVGHCHARLRAWKRKTGV